MAAVTETSEQREQTRARYPDVAGFVERDGVRVRWERYGIAGQTVLLLPTWEIVHSRVWKCQIPYLARRFEVKAGSTKNRTVWNVHSMEPSRSAAAATPTRFEPRVLPLLFHPGRTDSPLPHTAAGRKHRRIAVVSKARVRVRRRNPNTWRRHPWHRH